MKLNLLEKAVLATVAYYDVLDYPLTGFEVFKYLIDPLHIMAQSGLGRGAELEPMAKIDYLDILETLKNLSNSSQNRKKYIQEKNGFYFLQGRDNLVETRIERQKISDQKSRKAKRIIKWLQFIPYIRMLAISGSVALDNAKLESDIDLLIIAKHKRIWTVRFLITFFIHIIGKRRYNKKIADRICLNHYISDESLGVRFFSLYNAQTYAHLVPILENEQGLYNAFQRSNQWIKNYLINGSEQKIDNQKLIKQNKVLKSIAKFKEIILNTFLGDFLEWFLKIIQKKIIKYHSKKDKGQGRVITDDFQLEFHPGSPEAKVLEKYNKNMLKLGFRIKPEKDSGLMIGD